jgi:DNA polymerase I-like protein with 3'-5' exonuclease and polymerase domains
MYVFDIESDGLLDTISKLHCINAIDRRTGREYRFTDHEYYQNVDGSRSDVRCPRDGTIRDALDLMQGQYTGGHNVVGYDVPAIEIVTGVKLEGDKFDSAVLGKLAVPNLKDKDFTNIRKGKMPGLKAGSNKLVHWAMRVGKHLKTDFDPKDYGHTWATMPFTQTMDDYCMDDVRATVDIIAFMEERLEDCPIAVEIEMGVAEIITWQERVGIQFNEEAANELASTLYVRLHELEGEARKAFAPFYQRDGKVFIPKRDNAKLGYVKGAPVQKLKLVDFNPGSRQQIENRLRWKYDWEPTELTDKGRAKIDDEVLSALPFPETQAIGEYMMVQKRLSQLAEGKQAWLKAVKKDGRIYGRVDQLGTGTGRMSHFGPNLAQVPKSGKPYGAECRALFTADPDRAIVGCDADALELRILAHFLARYDRGEYVATVLDGSKANGTDMHSRNRIAVGLDKRETAKRWFYAFIYGAGDFKLGTIVLSEWDAEKLAKFYKAFPPGNKRRRKIVAIGKRSRSSLLSELPAFGKLVAGVHKAAERGYLRGIDGRKVPVRSKHSALNFLCQGAGALVMKRALIIMFDQFEEAGLDVLPLLNVHDEVQLSVKPEEADDVGRIAAQSIADAGEAFSLRCPLAGDYDVGPTWAETH